MPFYLSGAVHYLLKGTWTAETAPEIPASMNPAHKDHPLSKLNALHKGRKGEL